MFFSVSHTNSWRKEVLNLGWGSPFGSVNNTVTTLPTVSILPHLFDVTNPGTVNGGWAWMESGLLELQEDSFAALQMASPFGLMIPGPEVLQRLSGSLPQAIGAFNS